MQHPTHYSRKTSSSKIGDVCRKIWKSFTYKLKRVAIAIRRLFYGDSYIDEKQSDISDGLILSKAWTVPATGIATWLLFRNEFSYIIENLIGENRVGTESRGTKKCVVGSCHNWPNDDNGAVELINQGRDQKFYKTCTSDVKKAKNMNLPKTIKISKSFIFIL